jgi:hypothetical protein
VVLKARIPGPWSGIFGRSEQSSCPLELEAADGAASCLAGEARFALKPGEWSPWIRLTFQLGFLQKASAMCRFFLKSASLGEATLYMTPLNLDYGTPMIPVSHPAGYAAELAREIGPYATLGMPEDTHALNDGVLGDEDFLAMCDHVLEERVRMLELELGRFERGVLACVFDTIDRVQHLFWGSEETILRYYRKLDAIVGSAIDACGPDALVLVVSDHGFTTFDHEVHLNRWLIDEGYLALREGSSESPGLYQDIDWSRSRAYGAGLTSLYLNVRGREKQGIVDPKDADALKRELIGRLKSARVGQHAFVREVYDSATLYSGPQREKAPDLVMGYERGYRGSWQTAVGGAPPGPCIVPNSRKWMADHCCDCRLVPGVYFSNDPDFLKEPDILALAPALLRACGA